MNPSTETSGKPADIPQDVWDAAERIADANEPSTETLARTILAAKADERASLPDAIDLYRFLKSHRLRRRADIARAVAALIHGDEVNTAHNKISGEE